VRERTFRLALRSARRGGAGSGPLPLIAPLLRPAAEFTAAELATLFSAGYEGYYTPVALDAAAFSEMAAVSDFDLAASPVALVDGAPVAFALLGRRGSRGWIGGMGVIAPARGRGLGRLVMRAALDAARDAHLAEVDLEVLQQNEHAIPLYLELGFRDRRMLDVWVREPADLAAPAITPAATFALPVAACLARFEAAHAVPSPWQRDIASLSHWAPRLAALGVGSAAAPVAWVLYRVAGPRLNVADAVALQGAPAGSIESLLRELIVANPASTLTLVNLPADDPAAGALRALGAAVRYRQREMTLPLAAFA
jgi:ribosomal protein S18 acetylase RimI-like enzyme